MKIYVYPIRKNYDSRVEYESPGVYRLYLDCGDLPFSEAYAYCEKVKKQLEASNAEEYFFIPIIINENKIDIFPDGQNVYYVNVKGIPVMEVVGFLLKYRKSLKPR